MMWSCFRWNKLALSARKMRFYGLNLQREREKVFSRKHSYKLSPQNVLVSDVNAFMPANDGLNDNCCESQVNLICMWSSNNANGFLNEKETSKVLWKISSRSNQLELRLKAAKRNTENFEEKKPSCHNSDVKKYRKFLHEQSAQVTDTYTQNQLVGCLSQTF